MKITYLPGFVLLFALLFATCQRKKEIPRPILARVDERIITPQEFKLFYELDPNFGIDSSGYNALSDELNYLILEIKAQKKASQEGLLDDTVFKKAISWEKNQAIIRALYRHEIYPKIKIRDSDLRRLYSKLQTRVHVRHLFTRDRALSYKWYNLIKAGKESFSSLAKTAFKDTTLQHNGGDLGWVSMADLDDNFASGLDTLQKDEISRPVQSRWGFHIIQMIDKKQEVLIKEADYQRQKAALEKRLHEQIGKRLAKKYISSFMSQINPQPDPAIFTLLWKTIVPSATVEKPNSKRIILLDDHLIEFLRKRLYNVLDKPFIHFKGGSISLDQYLDGLSREPVSQRPRFKTARQLSNRVAIWFRDQLLLKKALEKHLDKDPMVKHDVERFIEEQSYDYYLNMVSDTLFIPEDVRNYFKGHSEVNPKWARFHTLQEWKWNKAQHILNHTLKKIKATIFIDKDLLHQLNRTIDWNRPIRMFMIRKPS